MWHMIFVAAHAITATGALITGIAPVLRSRLFGTYLVSLVAMEVLLVLAFAVQWSVYSGPARAAFAALAALGGVVVWQGLLTWQVRHARATRRSTIGDAWSKALLPKGSCLPPVAEQGGAQPPSRRVRELRPSGGCRLFRSADAARKQ